VTDSEKIQWLFDIEKIKQLKHRYCSLCDGGYDADALVALFTEDAVWDGGSLGLAEGRDQIHRFFAAVGDRVGFTNHYVTNPIIDIEGDSGTGRWDLWQPLVVTEGPRALWLAGKYRERYLRAGEGWLFERVELEVVALSPYEAGFAQQRFADLS
jgi:hypothetical protein